MSVKVAIRVPDELIARLDEVAERDGTTRTAAIVNALWGAVARPEDRKRSQHPRAASVAASIPSVLPASSLPLASNIRYDRPVHDPTCKCGMCTAKRG